MHLSSGFGEDIIVVAIVAHIREPALISWKDLVRLGYLHPQWNLHPLDPARARSMLDPAIDARTRLVAKYSGKVLSNTLNVKPMKVARPMVIHLKDIVAPVYAPAPRKVPIRFEEEAAKTIAELIKMNVIACLLYTSPSPRDLSTSRMPSSA